MSVKEENICRLCFNVPDNGYEVIDEFIREALDVLQVKMNLDVSENPIICEDCAGIVTNVFRFKSSCVGTKKCVEKYSESEAVAEDLRTCLFCVNHVEKNNFVPLDIFKGPKFQEMLRVFLPEMDLELVENAIICIPCSENLEAYFKLATNCLDTEEKINLYCQNQGTTNLKQVTLTNIFKHTLENPPKSNQIFDIKQELETFKDTRNVEAFDDQVKSEEDIKNEETSKDSTVELEEHPTNLEITIHKCDNCPYTSKQKKYLKRHMLSHKDASDVEMYQCTLCEFKTKYQRNLKTHALVHKDVSEVELYRCDECHYETKRKALLKCHKLTHRSVSEVAMHSCEKCTYSSRHKNHLKRHMLTHRDADEVKVYKCSICPFKTKYRHHLKVHDLVHKDSSEVEMYKCENCSYETKRKCHLNRHVLTHKNVPEIEILQA